jgi:acetyl-CoA carboxylase biotin carboxylase subunit
MRLQKVLVANRGEIAVRIIRACQELGISTVAVYSEADATSKHVMLADEAYFVGKASALESYMNIPNILSAARESKADAIHPGYGFLAENQDFAKACEDNGYAFIGPKLSIMKLMSSKIEARETAVRLGVPVAEGNTRPVRSKREAIRTARKVGYPVLIKPSGGGGGRGLRVARNERELNEYWIMSEREANLSFADAGVFLEKYMEKARHVEVQILADNYGNVLHLGERDCTIQRRHQKLIEESPSPVLNEDLRKQMIDAALKLAVGIEYNSVGTVEFILDQEGNFYFIEMNTRIQVEHPVSEMVTGVDLVKEQIRIAAGEKLSYSQDDIKAKGWALECRINAEDPEQNFMPCPGLISFYERPAGNFVRVDDYVYSGYELPYFYDSLMGKVITWGNSREEAIARMKVALNEFKIEGISTTIPFHLKVLSHPQFIRGDVYTTFAQELVSEWIPLEDAAGK